MLTIFKFCTPVILIVDYMSLKCNLVLVNNVEMLENMYFNESCVVFLFFICSFKWYKDFGKLNVDWVLLTLKHI
jgi:hypothetical protein